MTAQTESKRPALQLIVNDDPHLCARRKEVHTATVSGEVVDPFWASVVTLADHLKSEYRRITTENPSEGPTVKVSLPEGCTFNQIEQAFKLITDQGWDIFPALLHSSDVIYLRNYQC